MTSRPPQPPGNRPADRPEPTRLGRFGAQAAEVADELRRPLSLLVGNLEILESQLARLCGHGRTPGNPDQGDELADAATLIRICVAGARRLETLTAQLAASARGSGTSQPAGQVDIGRLFRTTIDLAARAVSHPPAVTLDIPPLAPVHADENALAGAFANLVRTIFETLSHVPAPAVQVTAATIPASLGIPPAVEIVVSDNGPGIAPEDRDGVFEPFLTRGPYGRGLDLALARELIEAQGGTIVIGTPAQGGTAFCIRLPAAEAGAGSPPARMP